MLICLNVLLIFVMGSFNFVSNLFMDGTCVVARALATKTMSKATIHHLVAVLLMRG